MQLSDGVKPLGRLCVLVLASLLLTTTWAQAQESSDTSTEAEESTASGPYEPPLFSFDNGAVDLIEAVRLTLSHDPNLLLVREDVRLQEGILQESTGLFDWTLSGEFSFQHEEKELLEGVKQREQDERDDLTIINGETCQIADEQEAKLAQLQQAQQDGPGVRVDTDPIFDLRLRLLDERIARAMSPAQLADLERERNLLLTEEIFKTEGRAESNRDACTESDAALGRLGEIPDTEETDSASLSVRLEKTFRTGLTFSPFFEGSFNHRQFEGKTNGFREPVIDEDTGEQIVDFGVPRFRFIDFGGTNIRDNYLLRVGFDVNLPLLRSRGRDAVGAAERAAESDLEATALLLKHAASESVLTTAASYWNLLAAQERVEILESSVELQKRLLEITEDLVEADEVTRSELSRARAGTANAEAQLRAGARDRVSARLALLQAMGLDARSERNIPGASGEFPDPPSSEAIEALQGSEALANDAVERRYDVGAARYFVDSENLRSRAFQIDLRPLLDLSAGAWTTATGENSLSEATDEFVVPSFSVGLAFEKPFGNKAAKGRLAQSAARVRQNQISSADLERLVRINVVLALNSLAEARARLESARESAEYFEETVKAEIEKYEAGESTLVDTILTEQQRTGSLLSRAAAAQDVAILLVQLRFETGTLVSQTDDETSEVTLPMITTLPGNGP